MSTERPKTSPSVGRKCGDPTGIAIGVMVAALIVLEMLR